jgi:anti-sigma factor RsiW
VIRLSIWSRRALVCQQAVELVTDYLEGALSLAQRHRFDTHLARCPDCPEYLAQMRAIIALAGSITPEDLSPHMRSELIRLYLRWRADEAHDNRS